MIRESPTSAARFVQELREAGFTDICHPFGQVVAHGKLKRGNQTLIIEAFSDGSFVHFLQGAAQTYEDALIECGVKQQPEDAPAKGRQS